MLKNLLSELEQISQLETDPEQLEHWELQGTQTPDLGKYPGSQDKQFKGL
jgi:hypothetical protein